MATDKQIAANRLNAQNSTGPRTDVGKRRSRRNAFRHGLTAETVIDIHEDPAAYRALERAINADYRPRTNFELELVARLVSLLWRLRRAVAIESGLLDIQAERLRKHDTAKTTDKLEIFYKLVPSLVPAAVTGAQQRRAERSNDTEASGTEPFAKPKFRCNEIAHMFLKLASLDNGAFERLSRYEMSLWRQTVQVILLLNSINRGSSHQDVDCNDKFFRLRNATRRSRHILWPPFVPLG